ncbi:ornithine decarboxylase-like, partial [Saccoglossus kowalevskii]|uniref:Ornithine decarboxylase-like n=1 Tax=Saccoglossus kowalevskii TaxID=10224 RepID=A0ABM0MX26_SACKO
SEIEDVLNIGVPASRIIYANPCKSKTHLQFAADKKAGLMTFDDEYELHKITEVYPDAELVIRINTDDPSALASFGIKFGCDVKHTRHLLQEAKQLSLNVVGVSFHVGSSCRDATAYATAIGLSRLVFNYAADIGFNLTLLDIGGGYPGDGKKPITIQSIAEKINQALSEHFPDGCGVTVISEPGLYFAWSTCTLCVNVIGKRVKEIDMKSVGEDFGGYTMAGACRFNGFTTPSCLYMATQSVWSFLKPRLVGVGLLNKNM